MNCVGNLQIPTIWIFRKYLKKSDFMLSKLNLNSYICTIVFN
ncbi:hypothetical protein CCAND38_300012 [Capnocytophaga canis]|uniref:Uncharacterized protein n=1 Tax=Capnocytophaga canis TaxID=1848903 RepID=A0A0B7I2J7_9FLAO|nr:hypothetical protein CCAND38_300012 [Capnocytophaga canis]